MNAINPEGRYETEDNVRILNPKQAAFYFGNGLKPIDIYPGKDRSGEYVLIYVFPREETQKTGLYERWCKGRKEKLAKY